MLPDRVSNPGPLTYESGALPIALRGPGLKYRIAKYSSCINTVVMVTKSICLSKIIYTLLFNYVLNTFKI